MSVTDNSSVKRIGTRFSDNFRFFYKAQSENNGGNKKAYMIFFAGLLLTGDKIS